MMKMDRARWVVCNFNEAFDGDCFWKGRFAVTGLLVDIPHSLKC